MGSAGLKRTNRKLETSIVSKEAEKTREEQKEKSYCTSHALLQINKKWKVQYQVFFPRFGKPVKESFKWPSSNSPLYEILKSDL